MPKLSDFDLADVDDSRLISTHHSVRAIELWNRVGGFRSVVFLGCRFPDLGTGVGRGYHGYGRQTATSTNFGTRTDARIRTSDGVRPRRSVENSRPALLSPNSAQGAGRVSPPRMRSGCARRSRSAQTKLSRRAQGKRRLGLTSWAKGRTSGQETASAAGWGPRVEPKALRRRRAHSRSTS